MITEFLLIFSEIGTVGQAMLVLILGMAGVIIFLVKPLILAWRGKLHRRDSDTNTEVSTKENTEQKIEVRIKELKLWFEKEMIEHNDQNHKDFDRIEKSLSTLNEKIDTLILKLIDKD